MRLPSKLGPDEKGSCMVGSKVLTYNQSLPGPLPQFPE